MKCFVAGAGGYIGLPLCAELLRRGHQVTAFDTWYFGKDAPEGCIKVIGDIRDIAVVETDAVIDLAGLSNDAAGDIDPELTKKINIEGACRLAEAAKRGGVKHYIYSSSASVYGNSNSIGLTEKSECKPLTAYAESKVRVEDFLRKEADNSFQPIILRNATVFGVSPRMRFDLVVNGMTRAAYMDGSITIDGDGQQWRPFVHIDDLVSVFADRLTHSGGCTENVVSCNRKIRDVARYIVGSFQEPIKIKHKDGVDHRSYHLKETLMFGRFITDGIRDILDALEAGVIDPNDPTAWTVRWYREMCDLK